MGFEDNVMALALRLALFFLYRMDIGVGQCVSQASQRQSPSAKLFCFIALTFPAISTNLQSHTLSIWSRFIGHYLSYDAQLIFTFQIFPSFLRKLLSKFYRVILSWWFLFASKRALYVTNDNMTIYTFKWGHVVMMLISIILVPCMHMSVIHISMMHASMMH